MNRTQRIGKLGEDKACRYLKRRRFEILERNYWAQSGEIDIIARDREELVFVEVKTRSGQQFGLPSDAVNDKKKRHMIDAARYYIHQKQLYNLPARFDVIEIMIPPNGIFSFASVNHIKNAFVLS